MPNVECRCQSVLFWPAVWKPLAKIRCSSFASFQCCLAFCFNSGTATAIILSQYFVSPASFLQMPILFLKSFRETASSASELFAPTLVAALTYCVISGEVTGVLGISFANFMIPSANRAERSAKSCFLSWPVIYHLSFGICHSAFATWHSAFAVPPPVATNRSICSSIFLNSSVSIAA